MARPHRFLAARADAVGSPAVFPLRVAAVDMGSNAIRFQAAEFSSPQRWTVLASERRAVRLGHGVFLSGRLAPQAMDAAVEALGSFAASMRALGIEHCRAIATSAVREAANGEAFLGRVREETGLQLDTISGAEEARLAFLAVRSRVSLTPGRWLIADLGGGSVEVSLVDAEGILWCESHTIGSVRLLEELSQAGAEPGRFRQLLEEYISNLRLPAAAREGQVQGFVATGGNIEALARLAFPSAGEDTLTLPLGRLRATIETLARMSYRQRVDELGLREDRADVILPGALVYERLAVLAGCEAVTVPFVGLKDGVLIDLVEDLTSHLRHVDEQERVVRSAALTLGRRYHVDEAHATKVAEVALALFDQLEGLHGRGAAVRRATTSTASTCCTTRSSPGSRPGRCSSWPTSRATTARPSRRPRTGRTPRSRRASGRSWTGWRRSSVSPTRSTASTSSACGRWRPGPPGRTSCCACRATATSCWSAGRCRRRPGSSPGCSVCGCGSGTDRLGGGRP